MIFQQVYASVHEHKVWKLNIFIVKDTTAQIFCRSKYILFKS